MLGGRQCVERGARAQLRDQPALHRLLLGLGGVERRQRRSAGQRQLRLGIGHALAAQPVERGACRGALDGKLAAAGQDGRQHAIQAVGHEQEHGGRRRLLERLQQRVRAFGLQGIQRIDHHHAQPGPVRAHAHGLDQRAHLLHADDLARRLFLAAFVGIGLGRGVQRLGAHHGEIGVVALAEPVAGRALAAGLAVGQRRLAQQPLREMQRQVALADALLAMDQQGMREPFAQDAEPLPVFLLPGIEHVNQ
ncbi:hypothetical protein D3C81_1374080 [compost metagenome]